MYLEHFFLLLVDVVEPSERCYKLDAGERSLGKPNRCAYMVAKKPVWPLPFELDHSHPWNVLVGSYDLHNLKWQLDGVQTKLAGGPLR